MVKDKESDIGHHTHNRYLFYFLEIPKTFLVLVGNNQIPQNTHIC